MNRALLMLTALLLSGHGALAQSGGQKAWDETLKGARQEGKVVVAGPPDTQVRQTLPAAFEARYGIKMEYVTGRGSDQAAKLRREREAGLYTTDAVLAGSQTMFTVLHREKMLAPLKPELILPDPARSYRRQELETRQPLVSRSGAAIHPAHLQHGA
jgi:ABC-type uncharacterized transport system YnjBCD substrate-binding protein